MLFVLWIPLGVALVVFIGYIVTAIQDSDIETAIKGFFNAIGCGFVISAFCFMLGSTYWVGAPAHAYQDMEKPQYIAEIPGYETSKYAISTESLLTGERLTYYLINEDGQPEEKNSDAASIRIIEEDITKPYMVEIKYKCDGNRLWVLFCLNPSPYSYELHVPDNSIISINP